MKLALLVAEKNVDRQTHRQTHGQTAKMKNFKKSGLVMILSWPKCRLEPKFHETGTFDGFGKREHTYTRFMFYKYRYLQN